ncbi:MAG TPA: Ig-like domain-containing protein, partial [Ignavibacteria bacterium]
MKKLRFFYVLLLIFSILTYKSIAQQVSLTGKVINPDEKPIKKVFVYLANNPTLYCYSDSLGNFSLTDIITSVTEIRQEKIISFENRKLSLYANNQSVSVDVIAIDGRQIMNIVNLDKSLGTFGLYPEAYISGLPKAIYVVRARIGNTFQSFKIQNIIPSGFQQGITQYDISNKIDNSYSEPKSMIKSGVTDTLVLVHDFYKSRKIPLSSYSMHYDTIHLNNFADYTIAKGFEPSVTYWYNGYGNFTNILSADSVQFIIDYDTLSILKGDLKVITIPVDKIESLDNSIKFISGLHFEPSGTQFLQPVRVTVLMKDSIPKNLVVFHCNDQGETYYIPYVSHESYYVHCIIFNINHFSSIGIGTGKIPTKSDPSKFTTSDQFISYLAQYVDNFDAVPDGLFTIWFNNVVAPMISKIITWEDFGAAFGEFAIIGKSFLLMGGEVFETLPFYGSAMEMFSEKMRRIWNECIVEYNGLEDKCLKRAIVKIASDIIALNQLLGDICTDLTLSNFNDLCNGEVYKLANKIEFSTPVKHLEVGGSYVVQYTLKSIPGDVASIPEVVSWSSSNPSVASIDANGKVIALKDGVTTIKGKICDIENTFEVGVGGVNCEKDYCLNKYNSCYSGTYKCTGVSSWARNYPGISCPYESVKSRFTLVGNIQDRQTGYLETLCSVEYESYNPSTRKCERRYSYDT